MSDAYRYSATHEKDGYTPMNWLMKKTCQLCMIQCLVMLCLCQHKETPKPRSTILLSPVFVRPLDVQEPSDLCLDYSGNYLWTVSDKTGEVYKLDMTGKTIKKLPFASQDLEGIAMPPSGQILYLIEETQKKIISIDTLGTVLSEHVLNFTSTGVNGFEGVTVNVHDGHLFLVHKKNPGTLVELDPQFATLQTVPLKIATDYSGICYDSSRQALWIVSDESQMVVLCDPSGRLIDKWKVGVVNPEGIAVDLKRERLFIVSDQEQKLYAYELPDITARSFTVTGVE
jgi:uncharacterized protein YjiK